MLLFLVIYFLLYIYIISIKGSYTKGIKDDDSKFPQGFLIKVKVFQQLMEVGSISQFIRLCFFVGVFN